MASLRSQKGITFISVIFMVMIIGLMLAMTGQSWKRLMQREREEELLFRGMQIYQAISSWHRPKIDPLNPNAPPVKPPPIQELKDLLKDPRSQQTVRYLRRLYLDPVTGKEFEVLKGANGVVGVMSSSGDEPLKQAYFQKELMMFEGKKSYREWQFVPAKLRATFSQPIGSIPSGSGASPPTTVMQEGTGRSSTR